MTFRTAPCDWPVSYGGCDMPDGYDSLDDTDRAFYEDMATEFLWRWTGKSLGVCSVTLRPQCEVCYEGMSTFNGSGPVAGGFAMIGKPVIIDGLWWNVGCGRCGSDICACGHQSEIALPGPVVSIESVAVSGLDPYVIPPTAYRVDNHRFLVRIDGALWPRCDLHVTYLQGVEVPAGGQIAAGILAVELWKAAKHDTTCGLPQRVQTITRQGVTIAMLDAFDDIDSGHTGIWLIDSWVASVTRAPARALVYSPDVRPVRRTTS